MSQSITVYLPAGSRCINLARKSADVGRDLNYHHFVCRKTVRASIHNATTIRAIRRNGVTVSPEYYVLTFDDTEPTILDYDTSDTITINDSEAAHLTGRKTDASIVSRIVREYCFCCYDVMKFDTDDVNFTSCRFWKYDLSTACFQLESIPPCDEFQIVRNATINTHEPRLILMIPSGASLWLRNEKFYVQNRVLFVTSGFVYGSDVMGHNLISPHITNPKPQANPLRDAVFLTKYIVLHDIVDKKYRLQSTLVAKNCRGVNSFVTVRPAFGADLTATDASWTCLDSDYVLCPWYLKHSQHIIGRYFEN